MMEEITQLIEATKISEVQFIRVTMTQTHLNMLKANLWILTD